MISDANEKIIGSVTKQFFSCRKIFLFRNNNFFLLQEKKSWGIKKWFYHYIKKNGIRKNICECYIFVISFSTWNLFGNE